MALSGPSFCPLRAQRSQTAGCWRSPRAGRHRHAAPDNRPVKARRRRPRSGPGLDRPVAGVASHGCPREETDPATEIRTHDPSGDLRAGPGVWGQRPQGSHTVGLRRLWTMAQGPVNIGPKPGPAVAGRMTGFLTGVYRWLRQLTTLAQSTPPKIPTTITLRS